MKALLALLSFLNGVISFRVYLEEKRSISLCCSLLWFITCGLHLSALLLEPQDGACGEPDESSDYAD